MKKRAYRSRPRDSERPIAAVACALIIIIGGWVLGWWIVPIAAFIASAIWYDRATVVAQVTSGAIAAWLVLLLIDSMHGRTWALSRAAGGVIFLPWGLLFPFTLLFAAAIAWSTATLVQALTTELTRRRA